MNLHLDRIQTRIEPIRQNILNHPLYSSIKSIDDLQIFMQYHVYAVWDFMSLLKSLQQNLTCTTIPWFPKGTAETRQLINEIVVGEEADINLDGEIKSHFEMYLDAMNQVGASTNQINAFITELSATGNFNLAYTAANSPEEVKQFVDFTFEIIANNKPHLQAAVFTFGREDLIPGMFMSLVKDLQQNFPDKIAHFKYYLERHIEVDGDHHSNLAIKMTENLCGDDDKLWKEAEIIIVESLKRREQLWDGALKAIKASQFQMDNVN